MDDFASLLAAERAAVERFVRFRIPSAADADDVLQDIYLTACRKFPQLKARESFKAWLISIARSRCTDYFRLRAANCDVPLDELDEIPAYSGGTTTAENVYETLGRLGGRERQILQMYYLDEMPQAEIARKLGIPTGTVKSRLHTAKRNFRKQYPYCDKMKGDQEMKKLPEFLPNYSIERRPDAPFSVKWEELMGWFLVPRLGEKLSWGMYDIPSRRCSYIYDMQVTGRAKVHGIEGVELTAKEVSCLNKNKVIHRTFVAQLTDTHCRYLATLRNDGDVRNYITFLDGEEFMPNWGFGEDNCGNETNLSPKGDICRSGSVITSAEKKFLLDIVGRYTVCIAGKRYDTVCVMDIETYDSGVVSEQYLDENGRTVLWRRFNRDDWAIERYKRNWSELLPDNERLTINGVTYVQWYDCITDYIL